MASTLVVDSARLLRLAPLIGTTVSLTQAATDNNTEGTFAHPSVPRAHADKLLPKWFEQHSKQVVSVVLGFNALTTSTTIANVVRDYKQTGLAELSTKLYLAGAAFAIGHLVFVPWVVGPIKTPVWNIMDDKNKDGAVAELEGWLKLHRLRTLVADLPAFLFCFAAVLSTPL